MMKTYDRSYLGNTEFAVYSPKGHGSLPMADLMFSWEGLETWTFDSIFTLFKDAELSSVTYTILKNTPGIENAMMVDNGRETYSVVRSSSHALNFRGYPFGLGRAKRVISFHGSQLLMYNTTNMWT